MISRTRVLSREGKNKYFVRVTRPHFGCIYNNIRSCVRTNVIIFAQETAAGVWQYRKIIIFHARSLAVRRQDVQKVNTPETRTWQISKRFPCVVKFPDHFQNEKKRKKLRYYSISFRLLHTLFSRPSSSSRYMYTVLWQNWRSFCFKYTCSSFLNNFFLTAVCFTSILSKRETV